MHALQFVLDQEREPTETVAHALISGSGTGDAYNDYVAQHRAEFDAAQRGGEQAKAEFNVGFWHHVYQGSGASALPPKLALVHFDAAVNHGGPAAARMLRQSGGDPERYVALREQFYRQIPNTSPTNPTGEAGGYGEGGPADNPGWLQKRMPALRAAIGAPPAPPEVSAIGRLAQQREED